MKFPVSRLLRGKSRAVANLSVMSIASAAFLVVATNADGYRATNVDLNDGSVWVTNEASGQVGRLNIRIDELDFGLGNMTAPDVVQEGRSVLVGDAAGVQRVEVDTGNYSPPTNKIPLANYHIGGGRAALLDPTTGKLWTGLAQILVAPEYPKKASGQVPAGSSMVVTTAGKILIVDRSNGVWFEVLTDKSGQPVAPVDKTSSTLTTDPGASVPVTSAAPSDVSVPDTAVPITPTETHQLANAVSPDTKVTAVGDHLVFLGPGGSVFGPTGKVAKVPGTSFVLQQPGPQADAVLVGSDQGLFEVKLGSDAVTQLSTQQGNPAAPVRVASCVYGAWSATQSMRFRACAGEPARTDPIPKSTSGDHLVFRVNQNNVAINSTGNGGAWAEHDGRLTWVGNWGDVQGQDASTTSKDPGSSQLDDAQQQCVKDRNVAPVAVDDARIGVRARPTIIDVLANDSDQNCEPIAVASIDTTGVTAGDIQIVDNGQHLLFSPSADLRDGKIALPVTFSFTYVDADSSGALSQPAKATVVVTDPKTTNLPPELRPKGDGKPRKMRTQVESGKFTSYDVLADWWDPDGDDIRLVSATAPQGRGAVTFSPAGTVRYVAAGVPPGIENIDVRVSDGQAQSSDATGQLEVTVQPQGQAIKPVAQNDFVTVAEGATAVVHPLANDSDGNGPDPKLSANFAGLPTLPPGLTAQYDSAHDALTVTGVAEGVYPIAYQVTDGIDQADGTVRVVVTHRPDVNTAPVAVPDRVVIRPGRVVNVDVLTNDIDRDGDLLAVVSAKAGAVTDDNGGVRVSVIDRRVLQVELVPTASGAAPVGPFFIDYSIDDGHSTDQVSHVAAGLLTVLVDPSTTDQAPVTQPDTVTVRSGDVASVAVLANDTDPDGDRIQLVDVKADEAAKFQADGAGVVWADKQTVKVRGGVPGSYTVHYDIVANGKAASGELHVQVNGPPGDQNLNQAPTPKNLEVRGVPGTTTRVAVSLDGIDPDGDSVSLLSVGATAKAAEGTSVKIDPSDPNRLLYSVDARSTVNSDSFTYTVQDSFGAVNTANARVVVVKVEPTAPVAHDDVVRARPGRVLLVPVLANDVSPDDKPLSLADKPFLDAQGQPTIKPLHPDAVSVVADTQGGIVTGGRLQVIVPFADQPALTERYQITDGANFANAYVRVIPDAAVPNVAPIATPDIVLPEEIRGKNLGDAIVVDVTKNDSDPDDANATLTVSLPAKQAMPGVQATTDGTKVSVTLTADPQVIVYLVTDSDPVAPATSYGIIRVPGVVNHPPRLNAKGSDPSNFKVEASPPQTLTFVLGDVVEDPDGDPNLQLTDTEITAAGTGTVKRIDKTSFTFTPNDVLQPYQAQVTFEVIDRPGDSHALKAPLTIFIPVSPGNTPPVSLGAGQVKIPQLNEPVTYDLAPLMRDDQGDPLTFTLLDKPQGFDVQQTGSILTIKSTNETVAIGASFTIHFTATDNGVGHQPVQGSLTITVTKTNRGQPVAANVGPLNAVRGEASAGVDVVAQSTNPFPEQKPLSIESVTATQGGSVSCANACGQSPIVFTPTQVGTFTVNYVVKDAVGQTASGAVTYVVKGRALAPGVPEVGSVGDQTVNLTWAAADMQGGTLVKYVVTAVETGAIKESTSTAVAFDGLQNSKTFHFTVYAVNEIPGNGAVSGPSNAAIPDRVPDPPINVRFTDYGDATLTLNWDPPTTIGNYSTITTYEINLAGFGIIPTNGPVVTLLKSGLTNGVDYTFTVRAKNAATTNGGWGGSSSVSASQRPSRYPDPPTAVTAVAAGDGGTARAKVTWAAPAFDGGRAISSYTVCRVQAPGDCQTGDNTRQVTFTLPTGSANSFTVIAHNTDKNRSNSDVSAPSNALTGIVTPGAPTVTNVASGDTTLSVSANPGTNGGCSTSFLQYALDGGAWQTGNAFGGLTNGQSYTATARMTLGIGCVQAGSTAATSSGPSNAIAQIPYGPLGTPSISSSVSGPTITWNWNTNQGPNGRQWTATISGACSGWAVNYTGGGSQAGSCTYTGYNSGSQTVYITVSAPGVAPTSSQSSNATGNPPPPPQSVAVSWGAVNNTIPGCSSNCRFLTVTIANIGLPYTVSCESDNSGGTSFSQFYSYVTSGNPSNWCVYGVPPGNVRAVVNGIVSNSIIRGTG